MITITNGQMTLTVPNASYRGFFAASGFHPLADQEHVVAPNDTLPTQDEETPENAILDEETDESEDVSEAEAENEEIDLSEIPLSEMDFYQLCDYADQLGIDRRGIRSKKELRALIKSNL